MIQQEVLMQSWSVIGMVLALVFSFWWLVLLSSIRAKKLKLINFLRQLIVSWAMLLIVRVTLIFVPNVNRIVIIPEPYNTGIFLLVGPIVLILYIFIRARRYQLFWQKAGPIRTVEHLLELSPAEFEQMVAEMFRSGGHKALVAGKSGDDGVDVIVKTKNGEKWIVQCKRWQDRVGAPIVRDFYGAMQHEKAARGMIVAVGGFTEPAEKWAKGKPIKLCDGEQFLTLWHKSLAQRNKKVPAAAV